MNREVLFKAKRKDWRTLPKEEWWVEGYYVYCRKRHYILPVLNKAIGFDEREDEWIEIDPDTICQYTGLTDKNGQKIWENDILRGYQYPYRYDGNDNYFAEVTWFENCPAFGIYTFKNPKSNVCGISEGNTEFMENWNSEDWGVIGNIFDNADLLEVE